MLSDVICKNRTKMEKIVLIIFLLLQVWVIVATIKQFSNNEDKLCWDKAYPHILRKIRRGHKTAGFYGKEEMKTTTIQRKSVYDYKLVGAFLTHKKSISRDIIDIQVKKL